MKPLIPIVDKQDNIITYKDRKIRLGPDDIYRVLALWVTNSKGEVLLARRAYNKSHDPGQWGPAVAGTVEQGETYETNIYKEAEEELGIRGVKFELGPKFFRQAKWNYFVQQFIAKIDQPAKDFRIQPQEVAEVKWFSKAELKDELAKHPNEFLESVNFRLVVWINSDLTLVEVLWKSLK